MGRKKSAKSRARRAKKDSEQSDLGADDTVMGSDSTDKGKYWQNSAANIRACSQKYRSMEYFFSALRLKTIPNLLSNSSERTFEKGIYQLGNSRILEALSQKCQSPAADDQAKKQGITEPHIHGQQNQ